MFHDFPLMQAVCHQVVTRQPKLESLQSLAAEVQRLSAVEEERRGVDKKLSSLYCDWDEICQQVCVCVCVCVCASRVMCITTPDAYCTLHHSHPSHIHLSPPTLTPPLPHPPSHTHTPSHIHSVSRLECFHCSGCLHHRTTVCKHLLSLRTYSK